MTLLRFNHIFRTPASNTAITWLQDTYARVCVGVCVCEGVGDDWLIRFSQWLKEGRKWLSAHPTLSGWIPPVAAWRAPSIWRGA